MTSIERTAYSRFRRAVPARELHESFTPGLEEEVVWAREQTRSLQGLLTLLVLLKSFQRLGCFPDLFEVPVCVVDHVRRAVGVPATRYCSLRRTSRPRPRLRRLRGKARVFVRSDGNAASPKRSTPPLVGTSSLKWGSPSYGTTIVTVAEPSPVSISTGSVHDPWSACSACRASRRTSPRSRRQSSSDVAVAQGGGDVGSNW